MRWSLAAGAIIRDEARYLPEWIRFHLAMGIEHFFVYDNYSVDHPATVLAQFVEAGRVTLIPWNVPIAGGGQVEAYADCLVRSRDHARWVAFLDIDEFLFSPEDPHSPTY